MIDPDLQELAELWQEPEVRSLEFEEAARRARRQGKLLAYADLAFFVMIVGGSAFAALSAPGPVTMIAAVFLLIGTVWLTWTLRKIRQMRRTLDTRDTFLASSVQNARSDLRRATLSIIAFPLLVPAALLIKVAFRTHSDISHPLAILTTWAQSTRGILTLCALSLVIAYQLRSRMKAKGELRRLEQLRQAYAEETQHEASNGS
ncbi:MAG TPA: hypothetical protein VHM92_13075 [Allosphingosinicella sp.]|nr:hypothetical protein [Allosphingosinicella sp.]